MFSRAKDRFVVALYLILHLITVFDFFFFFFLFLRTSQMILSDLSFDCVDESSLEPIPVFRQR